MFPIEDHRREREKKKLKLVMEISFGSSLCFQIQLLFAKSSKSDFLSLLLYFSLLKLEMKYMCIFLNNF